ncbi:MAG: adenosylcobinamide-phosphate synthase CbiB [Geminicoccaceae bacterium]
MLLASASSVLAALLVALIADALLGEPPWLYARLPHPVVAMGRAITALEVLLLRPADGEARKRALGVATLLLLLLAALLPALGLQALLARLPGGWLVEGLLIATLLAQRSLVEHVGAVADALARDLPAARAAVARIVGRDPERLDAPAIGRAAVETLAENLSDGVLAPLFWGLVLGLPGVLAYKMVNTLDSMIGHRSPRHRAFGWASARLDDLLNLIPARASGILICLAGWLGRGVVPLASLRIMQRSAPRHRSPNAGWPEAAMAAVLGLRLAGPRSYGGVVVEDGWMGEGSAEVGERDVRAAIALAWLTWGLATGLVALGLVLALSL